MRLIINGKEIPPEKQGRKVKLSELKSMKEIEEILLRGKESGEKKARDRKLAKLDKENRASKEGTS